MLKHKIATYYAFGSLGKLFAIYIDHTNLLENAHQSLLEVT